MLGVLACILGGVHGCQKDVEDEHKRETPSVSEMDNGSNLCEEIAKVMCYDIFECCTFSDIEEKFGVEAFLTESSCRRDVQLLCENELASLRYLLVEGTVVADAARISECLADLLVEEICFPFTTDPSTVFTVCSEELFTGTIAEGGDCLFDVECAGEAYCAANRKCKNYPTVGQPCTASEGCSTDLYCGLDPEGERVCMAYQSEGGSCSPIYPVVHCAHDLYCEWDSESETGTCRRKKAIGEPCREDEPCLDGECLVGTCDDGRECYGDGDCTGTCDVSGGTCSSDDDCGGYCEVSGGYCSEDADCPGSCAISGGYCDEDWDCHSEGTCADSGATCWDEWGCTSYGTCSVSGYECFSDWECEEDEECIPDEECVPSDSDSCEFESCELETCLNASACGGRLCVESWGILDYCELGLNTLDYFGSFD
jgi:hypothetical protein